MGHNRNLADYAHHFDGTNIDLGSGNIETEGVLTYEDVTNVDAIGIITARAGVKVPDSQNISLGTGNDFAITHDGTNTTFINDTGQIQIRNRADDQDIILQTDDGSGGVAVYLRCDGSSGQVDLNHYGSRKFYTSSTGATVNGTLVSGSVTSELDLSAISSSISDTAVDVFVYDTRKDSDGGAWRKRTQHTSWYNETLNTATRGSRKEFPAVAVLVLYDNGEALRIYDGDDPDLPMWMDFTNTSGRNYFYGSGQAQSIAMLNGMFVTGSQATNFWPILVDFLRDECIGLRISGGNMFHGANIAGRNTSVTDNTVYWAQGARRQDLWYINGYIVNQKVNDVAMTVLPNAPIDDTTGLPIPTIAVGTDDGVSVIKDDGTVMSTASSSSAYHIEKVDFTDDHGLNAHIDSNTGSNKALVYVDDFNKLNGFSYGTYANWDGVLYANRYAANVLTYRTLSQGSGFPISDFISMSGTDAAIGSNFTAGGLTLLAKNNEAPGQGMVAFVTSDYNTGYMQGDIKRAFLSDTDTTNAVAAYYDDFANNNNNWGFVDASISSGNLVITQQGSARATDGDALNGVATGTKLTFTLTVSGSGTGDLLLDDDGAGAGVGGNTTYGTVSSTGSYTFNAYKTASNRLRFIRSTGSNNYDVNFLNISTEYDRSVNDKGIGVYGTITKSAVATGADLVAYSGFSASNYLENRSDYDFGAGTSVSMCIIGWFKTTNISTYTYIMSVYDSGTDHVAGLAINASSSSSPNPAGTLYLYDSVTNQTSGTTLVNDGQWHCAVGIFDGPNRKIYLDGKLQVSNTYTSYSLDIADTDKLTVGRYAYNDSFHFLGSLALTRISKSIPSPEQVKKMYEDEKVLFQENAKATLYGSSDAVTALGYDEDTELLHVGTSSGRSDFQGLRRINNTTTAVTTAISASDDLIAEQ